MLIAHLRPATPTCSVATRGGRCRGGESSSVHELTRFPPAACTSSRSVFSSADHPSPHSHQLSPALLSSTHPEEAQYWLRQAAGVSRAMGCSRRTAHAGGLLHPRLERPHTSSGARAPPAPLTGSSFNLPDFPLRPFQMLPPLPQPLPLPPLCRSGWPASLVTNRRHRCNLSKTEPYTPQPGQFSSGDSAITESKT